MNAVLTLALAGCLLAACGKPPAVAMHPSDRPPARLSEWGVLLAGNGYVELNENVVAYELTSPLFSDYASKLRTVWVPEGTTVGYRDRGIFDFPVGTIISKTFYYERAAGFTPANYRVVREKGEAVLEHGKRLGLVDRVLIETRLLVHYDEGWQALPYVWNTTQDEAWLEISGDVREIELVGDTGIERFVYVIPDRNQCAGCHVSDLSTKAMTPLGPKAWQLERDVAHAGRRRGQLAYWSDAGLLEALPEPLAADTATGETGSDLERRARAYLDANCAHCHNAHGPADTSALDLSLDAALDRGFGVCKPPVAVGRGSGNRPYDIVPGEPDASILVYRMQHSDPAIAMPELGRSTVHLEGVALIRDWITSLNGTC